MKVFGQLEKAQMENTTSDTGSLPKGMITYRTDLNVAKVSNGTSMVGLIDESSTQSMANKTITGGASFNQIATPSAPSAGFSKFYTKSDGKYYFMNSDGIEQEVGSGSGGGKNYLSGLKNGNFESNSTAKWSLFNTTLTGVIPTGTVSAGAASITTFATTATGKLAGNYSLNIASSGALSAGQGFITDAFTIDSEDFATVMSIVNYYKVQSGTVDMSGTSSNTFALYVYDVTNSAWIQPSGVYGMDGSGKWGGMFQSTAASTQYRVAILCVNATAGAVSVNFDDFSVGPQAIVQGSPITDPVQYTPVFTGIGTPTNVNIRSHRSGSKLVVYGNFTTGTATAVEVRLELGFGGVSGNVVAASSLPSVSVAGVVTIAANFDGTVTVLKESSKSYLTFGVQDTTRAGINKVLGTDLGSGNGYSFLAEVEIEGWSSNVQMSQDTDTRVVAAKYELSVGQSIPNSTPTTIVYDTKIIDTHSAFNPLTGEFTAPISGIYEVTASDAFAANGTGFRQFSIDVNGAGGSFLFQQAANGANGIIGSGTTIVNLAAGDKLSVKALQTSGGSLSLTSSGYDTVNIRRLSGPSVIAASETVAAKYQDGTGTTYPRATNITAMPFPEKVYDTHGAYNPTTGDFTVPISGKYKIDCMFRIVTGSQISVVSRFLLNTVEVTEKVTGQLETVFGAPSFSVSDTLELVAGDVVNVGFYYNDGGGADRPLTAAGKANSISFVRVGN